MALPWPVIVVTLAVTLAAAVVAVHEQAAAWEQRRRFAARSALDEAERRANSLTARLDARLRRTDLGRAIGRRIAAAGLRVRVSTFLLLMLLSGSAAVFLIGRYLAPVFGVAAAVGIGYVSVRTRSSGACRTTSTSWRSPWPPGSASGPH